MYRRENVCGWILPFSRRHGILPMLIVAGIVMLLFYPHFQLFYCRSNIGNKIGIILNYPLLHQWWCWLINKCLYRLFIFICSLCRVIRFRSVCVMIQTTSLLKHDKEFSVTIWSHVLHLLYFFTSLFKALFENSAFVNVCYCVFGCPLLTII